MPDNPATIAAAVTEAAIDVAQPEPAETPGQEETIIAAETAIALAQAQSSAAELDAAERTRKLREEIERWQGEVTLSLSNLRQSQAQTTELLGLMTAQISAVETTLSTLIPPLSSNPVEVTTETVEELPPPENAGEESPEVKIVKRRRWIGRR